MQDMSPHGCGHRGNEAVDNLVTRGASELMSQSPQPPLSERIDDFFVLLHLLGPLLHYVHFLLDHFGVLPPHSEFPAGIYGSSPGKP